MPREFNDFKIVHLSDLHIGNFSSVHYLTRCINKVNQQKPDLIIITGDLITYGNNFISLLLGALQQLEAKHGVFFSLGNHDYYCDTKSLLAGMQERGIIPLVNQSIILRKGEEQIILMGIAGIVDNVVAQKRLVEDILDKMGKERDCFKLLLAHDPSVFPISIKHSIELTLSGHTHSGQIALPFLPEINCSARRYPRNRGIYREANSVLHVSSGVGSVGLPLRLGAFPEITVLTIHRNEENRK